MATQYHNPPLPSNIYTGGAVVFDTRQLGQMLYNEQKQKEAQRQKELADLDNEMKSNVANIRDADVPDFVAGYQDYAAAKKRVLHDPSLKKDPQAYAAAQMEVAKKYGNVMKLANESKQARALYEDVDKDRFKNPDHYVDDFYDVRKQQNQLPLSKLRQVQTGADPVTGQPIYTDYSSPEVLIYKDQYDPTKLLTTARGEKLTNEVNEGPIDKTGLQNKVTTYQFYGSKPSEYKDVIMRGMAGDRAANRFFSAELKKTDPAEIARVSEQFNAIPADVWKRMGIDKVDLKVENPDNQAEVVATFLAQKHALENMPRAIKSDLRTNEAVKFQMDKDWALQMEGIKQKNREKQALLTNSLNKQAAEGNINGGTLDQYLSQIVKSAKDKSPVYINIKKGDKTEQIASYNLPLTEDVIQSVLNKGEALPEGGVRFIDGKGFQPIYYKKTNIQTNDKGEIISSETVRDEAGRPVVDLNKSTIRPVAQVKANAAKYFTSNVKNIGGQDVIIEEEDTFPSKRQERGERKARTEVDYDALINQYMPK